MQLQNVLSTLAVASLELALVIVGLRVIYLIAGRMLERATAGRRASLAESSHALRTRLRHALLLTGCLLAAVVLSFNGWLMIGRIGAWTHTWMLLGAIGVDTWIRLAIALAKLAAAALGYLLVVRIVRRTLQIAETALKRWHALRDHDRTLSTAFAGLRRTIVNTGWLLLTVYAFRLFSVPGTVVGALLAIARIYLVLAFGVLLIRSSVVIVDAFDGLAKRYAETREWRGYYDRLRPLVPTFRACLEYALWIALASLAVVQLGQIRGVTTWAPRAIEAIVLFFLGRVVIQIGHLEVDRRMLPEEGLDDMARRRRETMAPIVRSTFSYAVYFGTAVLILATLGFNPMPFLAGAGILGLVIGFGAQSLIHDVVSGFFILFENTYLIGDAIEAAGAKGVVEAIEFRTTKIRDADGRLHIVRNGDVKQVVNYSKEYAFAVIPLEVAYDADLPQVFAVLREAGERTRGDTRDVLGDIRIEGITAFGPATMTVRTSTRVRPGCHERAAAALRLAMKEAFDRRSAGAPRRTLVPESLARTPCR